MTQGNTDLHSMIFIKRFLPGSGNSVGGSENSSQNALCSGARGSTSSGMSLSGLTTTYWGKIDEMIIYVI